MKKTIKLCIFMFVVMTMVAGCSGGNSKKEKETEVKQELYPVSINGTEINVGETKVQALLDDGLKVTVSEMTEDKQINQYEIDPETQLKANTYYSGGTVWITDSIFAHISMVTGEEDIRMGDAVIARLEFSMSDSEAVQPEQIMLNGVSVNEITRDKAGEMFPDFQGDEIMWFQKGKDYDYFMAFNTEGKIVNFYLEKMYDVDWLGKDN